MSSSMRNAINRRPHRERAQPKERKRLGLLEKHKDYSLRAKDYNKKKEQLKALRRKAADRNDDEFYFGMLSRKGPSSFVSSGKRWDGTVAGDRGSKSLDMDTVRLLKTQDVGYVRTMRNVVAKEVARLEQQVLLASGIRGLSQEEDGEEDEQDFGEAPRKKARKIVFADDEEEMEEIMGGGPLQDGDGDDEDDEDGVGVQGSDDDGAGDGAEDETSAESVQKARRKLAIARRRLRVLTNAEKGLEDQRAKMAKTATSSGLTRTGKRIVVHKRKK